MTTPDSSAATRPGSVDFSPLAGRVRGPLLRPGDPGYDDARAVWNGRIDRRPAAILRCAGAADVMAGVRFARASGVMLSVRGGGHHTAGHAVAEGGLMLDLSPMNGVRVDPDARRVRVGPGATVRAVDHETQAFGLVTTGAPVSMVGMAGYTLGGGLGWTSRAHGLACDNLVAADVVTATGERVRAAADQNPELFWGLRGGSGNFGVVTSFEYRLHELGPRVLAGPIVHSMDAAPELLGFWRDAMADAPDALQCMPVIFALPPEPGSGASQGETVFALFPLWAGDPEEGEAAVRPFREVGSPLSDDVGLVAYAGLLASLDEMYRAGHRVYYRSAFFDTLPDAAIDAFVEGAAPVPTPFSSLFLEPLGGAIARVPHDATAFPHRERAFCVTAVPKWERPERDPEMTGWADRLFDALAPFAAPGVYVNYLDDVTGAAGDPWVGHRDRLRAVKRAWDPDNVFRMTANIRPD